MKKIMTTLAIALSFSTANACGNDFFLEEGISQPSSTAHQKESHAKVEDTDPLTVTALSNGGFSVTWLDENNNLHRQEYDSTGVAVESEF